MRLQPIVDRARRPDPWSEGDNIPWNDPDFSRRMLREHLSQNHDAASRRFAIIDGHVSWIHTELLQGKPSRILDLGCGPGLYANRLARAGHHCTGIDYSPASIGYARESAAPAATFVEGDLRTTEFGHGYDLVMLIYGEFNIFRPSDAETLLRRAAAALAPGGRLLLEPHTYAGVRAIAAPPRDWYSGKAGLWSDQPYLCLEEGFWNEEAEAAIRRYYVVDAVSGAVQSYSSSYQAYSEAAYRRLLEGAGFTPISLLEGLGGAEPQEGLMAILAQKA